LFEEIENAKEVQEAIAPDYKTLLYKESQRAEVRVAADR
jgi:hypothetical protein